MMTRTGSSSDGSEVCACLACKTEAGDGVADARAGLSRRGFLRTGIAASAAAGVLAGTGLVTSRKALAQSAVGPDKALAMLMEGNDRYVAQKLRSFDEDLDILKQHTAEQQQPFAAVLSCADSRVPVELVFDQTIGHVFVTRVAGNIATAEMIGSLEYGVAVLGAEAIMVMGHASCGAVEATIAGKAVPGQISGLYPYIRPAIDQVGAGGDANAVVRANAQIQARLLKKSSPVIADFIKQGKLKVVASYYDLATGKVALLD